MPEGKFDQIVKKYKRLSASTSRSPYITRNRKRTQVRVGPNQMANAMDAQPAPPANLDAPPPFDPPDVSVLEIYSMLQKRRVRG